MDILLRQVLELVDLALSKCESRACVATIALDVTVLAVPVCALVIAIAPIVA